MRFVKHHHSWYDEVWKKLVDSQVLRPSEMDGIMSNIDSTFQHASEEYRAEKAVESTKLAVWRSYDRADELSEEQSSKLQN